MSYDKPARHMREYLSVLNPIIKGETAHFDGEQYRVHGVKIAVPGQPNLPVLIAALGPVMLTIAGAMTDGTITWMTGPKTLESHILPVMSEAAKEAGRPALKWLQDSPLRSRMTPSQFERRLIRVLSSTDNYPLIEPC